MDEVWKRGQATVREVLEALNEHEKPRAYTTVMTIMSRLADKGMLERLRSGKTDVYSPVLSRDGYARARARDQAGALVAEFGDIALAQFARQVESLDPGRLAELRRMASDE